MVNLSKQIVLTVSVILILITPTWAKLIVNEILVNEPGSNSLLEWIEIYNDTNADRNLLYTTLVVDGTEFILGLQNVGNVEPYEYVVICKNISQYESVWGDNSGIWGDDDIIESYTLYQASGFELMNNWGEVVIQYYSEQSTLSWASSGLDGYSWERAHPDSNASRQSIDSSGSTPGRINSTRIYNNNLELLPISVRPFEGGLSNFTISIFNGGSDTAFSSSVDLYRNDDLDSTYDSLDLIAEINYNTIVPGDTFIIEYIDIFFGVYSNLLFTLSDDEDNSNNLQLVTAFGIDYPPIIINEFLANPQYDSKIEWIEIRNYHETDINLKSWSIGDSIAYRPITFSDYFLAGNSYLVLCKDSVALVNEYGNSDIPILEISSWPILNDNYDIVRIKDNYDLTSDSVSYDHTFSDNITWGRSESEEDLFAWGRSVVERGSPGQQNTVYTSASANEIELEISNNPLSLSSGNQMVFAFNSPPGENFIMRIYDLEGRVVKTLFNSNSGSFDGEVSWDGQSDNGKNLKVGIYILYIEISDIDSYKQTVVIAP